MKVILIKGCSSCPHGSLWELDGHTYICGVNQKVNKDGHNAPDWCELKDALQFIREVAQQTHNTRKPTLKRSAVR